MKYIWSVLTKSKSALTLYSKLKGILKSGVKLAISLVIIFMIGPVQSALASDSEGIAWIPTIKQGLEEARKLNKPVMLISAAPQCAGVSGIW